jgi:hypothetical protein
MSAHDNVPRTPDEQMHESQTRHSPANSGSKWIGIAVALMAIGFVAFMAMSSLDMTGKDTTRHTSAPNTPTTTSPPSTTTTTPAQPTK